METVARRVERSNSRKIIIHKKDCYTGKNPCRAVLFAQKRADETLCSARYPGPPMPFPYNRQSRNCDASRNFIDCNPQKGPPQKVPSARYCAFLHSPKSKGRQPAYTHRRLFFHPATKLLKRRVIPSHRNVTMSARKASFTGFSIAELRFCCT